MNEFGPSRASDFCLRSFGWDGYFSILRDVAHQRRALGNHDGFGGVKSGDQAGYSEDHGRCHNSTRVAVPFPDYLAG